MNPWDVIGWMLAIILGLVLATFGGAFLHGVITAIRSGRHPAAKVPPSPDDVPYWAAVTKAVVAHRLGLSPEEVDEMPVRAFQATLALMLKEAEAQKEAE